MDYPGKEGVLQGAAIEVFAGETVGLVGQSGSGKSTLALAILKLLDHTGARVRGRVSLLGRDLLACAEREMRSIRGRLVSLIPQSPASALNPALRIGTHLKEAWRAHSAEPWSSQEERVAALLESSGLPAGRSFLRRFPSEISVGQAQRVLMTMALLHGPALLIADEPTSALDLVTQREALDLLARIGKRHRMSILFISHDLPAVATLCQRVAILHAGRVVESGPVDEIMESPRHPYARQLVAAAPRWERRVRG
ncbi:MAG: ABC transporter ATP-binding protein [Bryobacteraceae bacterium]|nr:ABC transporter ATP-binding protein [Bryobacteraceae bacterium]